MQYGNFKFQKNKIGKTPFKSYYVVWKHDVQASTVKKLKRFKSYYVVWKLNSFVTYFIMYEV